MFLHVDSCNVHSLKTLKHIKNITLAVTLKFTFTLCLKNYSLAVLNGV